MQTEQERAMIPTASEAARWQLTETQNGFERTAKGLGWFSLGLGLAQLISPRGVARLIGAPDHRRARGTLVAIGLREVASGLGILLRRRPSGWLWARVGGDLVDLALLGVTLRQQQAQRERTMRATAAVLGVTVVDAISAVQLTRKGREVEGEAPFHVTKAITINRPPEEVYRFWRNFENLPNFTAHLEAVEVKNGVSLWRARAPAGVSVEWEAEVTLDRPNEAIAWRSIDSSTVPNQGLVTFRPAPRNRGTEVKVELSYRPPAGVVGVTLAKLFGEEPGQQIEGDLRRLKQVLETGEVVHSDASIYRGMHPARPPENFEELKGGELP
jgi:uncharacterized membrane protein